MITRKVIANLGDGKTRIVGTAQYDDESSQILVELDPEAYLKLRENPWCSISMDGKDIQSGE